MSKTAEEYKLPTWFDCSNKCGRDGQQLDPIERFVYYYEPANSNENFRNALVEAMFHLSDIRSAESLEAYNRECKRVDELTEEVDKKNLRIQELEKELERKKYWDGEQEKEADTNRVMVVAAELEEQYQGKIAELEGLLKEITASFDANDDYRFTNVKIKRMLNLL